MEVSGQWLGMDVGQRSVVENGWRSEDSGYKWLRDQWLEMVRWWR